MQIHNYVRPLWQNGPHVVHDAPPRVRTAFELLFQRRSASRRDDAEDDPVQVRHLRSVDLTVAWLQVDVELPLDGTGFSYRRARYLHAIAVEGEHGADLTPEAARTLFEGVYGPDLIAGIRTAQRWLHTLAHPADADRGRALFVGGDPCLRPFEASERRAPARLQRARGARDAGAVAHGIGRVALAEVEHPTPESLFAAPTAPGAPGRTPPAAATPSARPTAAPTPVGAPPSALVTSPLGGALPETAASRPATLTPVEAFDQAWARRSEPVAAGPSAPPVRDGAGAVHGGDVPTPAGPVDCRPHPMHPDAADTRTEEAAGATPTASLSALLRTRLSHEWPLPVADPDADTQPILETSRA